MEERSHNSIITSFVVDFEAWLLTVGTKSIIYPSTVVVKLT